jgi:hypothetical protein
MEDEQNVKSARPRERCVIHPRASSTKSSIRRPVWFLAHPAEQLQALPKFPGRNTAIQHTTASARD